jgi:hypothetical protein
LPLGNIVVPFKLQDSPVAFATFFYIGVKQQDNLAVASVPHNTIPCCGFVSPGIKVLKAFQECEESMHLQVLQTFTVTGYSPCASNPTPCLTTSKEVTEFLMLQNEDSRCRVFNDKDIGRSTCTRSHQDDGCQYSPGQAVFVFASNENHGKVACTSEKILMCISPSFCCPFLLAFPATILKVLEDLKYEVQWRDDPTDTSLNRFPQEHIRPCVLLDPENWGDDDKLVPAAPAEHDKTLSSSASIFKNILDALGAVGEYSAVFDCIFGNKDHFTHTDAPLLENNILSP